MENINRCVYCLKENSEITDDHVIARSFYPKGTPANIKRWIVPACESCNNEKSRLEKKLLERLGLCLMKSNQKNLGIADKALRAHQPSKGRNPKDMKCRRIQRDKIQSELIKTSVLPDEGLLPNFGTKSGVNHNGQYILLPLLHPTELEKLGEMMIRGLVYVYDGRIIEREYLIEVQFAELAKVVQVYLLLLNHGVYESIGPGVETWRVIYKDPFSGIFLVRLWGQFDLYGSVLPLESNCNN